jgi:hypothetical protein
MLLHSHKFLGLSYRTRDLLFLFGPREIYHNVECLWSLYGQDGLLWDRFFKMDSVQNGLVVMGGT